MNIYVQCGSLSRWNCEKRRVCTVRISIRTLARYLYATNAKRLAIMNDLGIIGRGRNSTSDCMNIEMRNNNEIFSVAGSICCAKSGRGNVEIICIIIALPFT